MLNEYFLNTNLVELVSNISKKILFTMLNLSKGASSCGKMSQKHFIIETSVGILQSTAAKWCSPLHLFSALIMQFNKRWTKCVVSVNTILGKDKQSYSTIYNFCKASNFSSVDLHEILAT